jgi:alkane 1-monooxygenase
MSIPRKIGFFTAFILPALVVIGWLAGGAWNTLTLAFVFLFIPLLDWWSGIDTGNVPNDQVKQVSEEFFYRFVTYLWAYMQLAMVLWGAWVVAASGPLPWWVWGAFLLSMSMVTGGIGITVAHELGHKKSALERFYSKALLMTVCYMHFYIEHNRGHHVWVATPHDPATARKHESFYAFWVRSVVGSYAHAWHLERDRLQKKGLKVWTWHNEMLRFTVLPLLFCGTLTLGISLALGAFAWQVPVFFFGQSFLAFTLLELVNYVEHYGIVRREVAPGRYERVNPLHSWNASHLISNFFLFQLQRHSDHHAHAIKRYQVLNHHEESPQLPAGYPTMIMLALVPQLWYKVMHPRLEGWQAISHTKVALE